MPIAQRRVGIVQNMTTDTPAIELVVFDLDSTLIHSNCQYVEARATIDKILEHSGFDARFRASFREQWDEIDKDMYNTFGVWGGRFGTSAATAAGQANLSYHLIDMIKAAADDFKNVACHPIDPMIDLVRSIRDSGRNIAILTRGDETVQAPKIRQARTFGFVTSDTTVKIVPSKKPEHFSELADLNGVQVQNAIAVGDSASSDVLPALEVGYQSGLFIDTGNTWGPLDVANEPSCETVDSWQAAADKLTGILGLG